MNYEFDYKVDTKSMLIMTLKGMYSSLAGVINLVFTFSMFALLIKFWNEINMLTLIILIVLALFFPVFQPIIIYKKLEKQLSLLPDNLKIIFNNAGMTIKSNDSISSFGWKKIKRISKTKTAIVIYTSEKNGYIVTKNIAKEEFDNLYKFIMSKVV